jgi:hypothetical protein
MKNPFSRVFPAPETWPPEPPSQLQQSRRNIAIVETYITYALTMVLFGGFVSQTIEEARSLDPVRAAWAGQCALRGMDWGANVLQLDLQVRGKPGDQIWHDKRLGGLIIRRLFADNLAVTLVPNNTPPTQLVPAPPEGIGMPVESYDVAVSLNDIADGQHTVDIMLRTALAHSVETGLNTSFTPVVQSQSCRVITINMENGYITSAWPVN